MEALSKQIILSTQSGRLKPDIRLGVAVSEFAQSLDEDRKREFQKMRMAGTQLCGRDAIRVTEELNTDSERRHRIRQPYGTKCAKFLDRLQTLASIGDVAVGGSQNIIATSVWCAVKLSLQTATSFRSYFERLSSLFMKLGASWELHNEFSQIFPQSDALQTFLCEYLIVLMRLCRKAVAFSNKSFGGQLWSSIGASFESEFGPLQEEMDKWGLMIQHKTQQLAAASVVDTEMFRRRDYKQRVLHLLSPNQTQHITTWRRHRRKGDCKWIYHKEAYKSWISEDTSSTLCISGKLGSGKTVTMANLVAQLDMHQTCAFFFCTFKEQESLKATTILGSIAFHLLDSISGDDPSWDALSRQEDARTRVFGSTEIIRVLTDLLPEDKKHVIVVDGLEDCVDDEIAEITSSLRHLMSSRKILFCYSARSGSMCQRSITQGLSGIYSISLEDKMHDEEIKAYITEEVALRRRTSQPDLFTDELVELVKKQLLAGAQGMFLWVALQLDSIFPSQSRTIITQEQIINLINNLPNDLPEAFERALEEIIDHRYGNSLMKIITAAPSPLALDEVRVALTVVPGDPVWHAARTPTNSTQLVALCGGNLLELDEEDGKVRFIHYSVVSHLLQPTGNLRTMLYHFTMQEAEALLGAICVTFLNMSISETAVTITRHVEGSKFSEKVIDAATYEQPLVARLAHHFRKKDRDHSISPEFDIGRLLAEIQAISLPRFDPQCFRAYAESNWLHHSRSFEKSNPVCEAVWHLWMALLCGNVASSNPPFRSLAEEPSPALSWAIVHQNEPLIRAIFDGPSTEPQDLEKFSQDVLAHFKKYDCCASCLGVVLVHLFQLTIDTMLFAVANAKETRLAGHWMLPFHALHRLLAFGANPIIPHTRTGNHLLRLLLMALGCIHEYSQMGSHLCDFTERVLALPNVPSLLRGAWVPHALRKILEIGNTGSIHIILSYRQELSMPANEIALVSAAVAQDNAQLVRTLLAFLPGGGVCHAPDAPPIQLVLEHQNVEMLQLLADDSGLNDSDVELHLGPATIYFRASSPEPQLGLLLPSNVFLEACKMLADDLSDHQIFDQYRVDKLHNESKYAKREELKHILLQLAKATPLDQLNLQCPHGNTALHYLTGGVANFNSEALEVASYLLEAERAQPWPTVKNKDGQTPLRRAINRASMNCWGPPYASSTSFLANRISPAVVSNDELWGTGAGDSILGFAILKGAKVYPVICSIIQGGAITNAIYNGATPLQIAVNMPSLDYAAQATYCLLAHGADPSLKFSTGNSLLDTVQRTKRNWLHHKSSTFAQEPCRDGSRCKYILDDFQQVKIWEWLISPDCIKKSGQGQQGE